MKKILLSLLVMLLGFSYLLANPVDVATARKAGENFARARFAALSKSDEMHLVWTTDAYYVFNIGAKGFVIVSADDCFRPLVGYSDEGIFDVKDPSPEMMYYLNSISQGREMALRTSIQASEQVVAEWAGLLDGNTYSREKGGKSFYLVETKWDQDTPYNKFCPVGNGGRSYAGCVATAMSQVMNYWKYPSHGYGSHSYYHYQFGELSADFSATEYDFDKMPNSIGEFSPVENIDAVALFMYHCGIAVDMSYSPEGSGAYSQDVPDAVLKYFGYSNRCRLHNRDNYSLEEFQALLKDQFDRGWPCYYSGQDTGGGGHAFVCDGYDDDNMFHFNWGWSGGGDGFFVIDGLDVSSYAFNTDQAVITNFVPSYVFDNTAKSPEGFTATSNGDDVFSVTLSWVNPSATLDGHPLDTLDAIMIVRDGVVVHALEGSSIGEAVTYIDTVGQPVTVNYSIHAVCHGCNGRNVTANGINLGPACDWTFRLTSGNGNSWGDGALSVMNASGVEVVALTHQGEDADYQKEIPQGRITMRWTAPSDTLEIGLEILDADENTVFTYQGPSSLMPQGLFYETVNTCGGKGGYEHPSNLVASVSGKDVVLSWTGVSDPGYGYIIYRDGLLYTMVSDATTYTDVNAVEDYHDYYVTAFRPEGESDPSNTICAMVDDDGTAPRNFDFELLESHRTKLTWEAPQEKDSLACYVIYRRTQGGAYQRVKLVSSSKTSFTDNITLDNGERYDYKIASMLKPDNHESMPAQSLRNPDLYYVEVNHTHIPTDLTLQATEGNQLLLQWAPALLAETYNLYCNGELVAEDLVDPQYTDTVRGDLLEYRVTGVLNGVESSPSNTVYYGNYAVGETNETQATLFPNPAQQFVTVHADGLRKVVVYNLTGQQLLQRRANGNELKVDLSGLEAGVYYFQINTQQGRRVQKVVLMK